MIRTPLSPNSTQTLEDANARLRELDELKDTFVALVSHELRTPMSLVLGYMQMGVEQLGEGVNPETRQYLETALENARHLAGIIQELTDFAKLQRASPVELNDPIALGEAVIQVFTMLRPAIESKPIKPSLDLPADIWELRYDGESLIVIFRNLISNAAKFTPSGGRVWVNGARVPGRNMVSVCVNDTAPPIPMEKQALIFQDFRQLENYLTRRYEGMGLGLAVARRTALALGGDITLHVHSAGNTFEVMLPTL
jgi:two-component system sensor histidine kinase BarA